MGFCIDDSCTQQVSHNFDKAPTSEEIQSEQVHKRGININPNEIGNSIGNTAQDVGNSLNNAAKDAGNTIQNVANTAIGGIDKLGQEAIKALLSAFDSFVPKVPTNVSFIITFSLFSLVFNVIGAFPGIGGNHTGLLL
ncbi:uncharacterized protein OCT59_019511 [Rhizophagus irregularis]|uniref:uncharacterized protein n=1 Tax=Rhizophagus irregularis TaxID=588596 RepID=UPI003331AB12|nr:hypothetical protein OCT59_019511 [Rhizophagus irregularis]